MATPKENPALTAKQEQFVREFLIDLNGAAAARRAGYTVKNARSAAEKLLNLPHVQDALRSAMQSRAQKTGVTAERVLSELAKVGFADIRRIFRDGGELIPIHELDDETASALAGCDIVTVQKGEGAVEYVAKVKLGDKLQALQLIGRHLGMFQDRLEVTGNIGLADRLAAARRRLAKP